LRICIVGAGAVGCLLAARLARADCTVSLLARGATLNAIQKDGLRLIDRKGEYVYTIAVSDDAAELGPQDHVIIATKAHTIAAALDVITPLLGLDTSIATAVNGIPWWYFHKLDGDYPGHHLDSVDPGGIVWNALGPERALGCVVYVAAAMRDPGVVYHSHGIQIVLGEPDDTGSARVAALSEALIAGGLRAPISEDIRAAVWAKLWGNLNANPVSALTNASIGEMVDDPAIRQILVDIAREGFEVATAMGVPLEGDPAARVKEMDGLGAFRTSMLQDMDAGKAIELDPIVGAVAELGRLVDVATPTIDMIYALTRKRAANEGKYFPMG
jgi:2-dehydropantoate 2-reductase